MTTYKNSPRSKALKIFEYELFNDRAGLRRLQDIVGRQIYIYPRLHSSLKALLDEIKLSKSSKRRVAYYKSLAEHVLDGYFFNEAVYASVKSQARSKFLNIGLRLWELIGLESGKTEQDGEVRTQILETLLSTDFLRVFVRSLSM